MDMRRFVLYLGLGLVGYGLWSAWQTDYPMVNTTSLVVNTKNNGQLLPQLTNSPDTYAQPTIEKPNITAQKS